MRENLPALLYITASLFPGISTSVDAKPWEESLAARLSKTYRDAGVEINRINLELAHLPTVPFADQGGSGGMALLPMDDTPEWSSRFTIRWPEPGRVDSIVLVPARLYHAGGVDFQYGLPDEFTVDLLDSHGSVVEQVATVRNTWSDPVRNGLPFFLRLPNPVKASGLRVNGIRLKQEKSPEPFLIHAWSEILAFEGLRNVAQGAEVDVRENLRRQHWHWTESYLVDGQMPLGFPELPPDGHRGIGWITDSKPSDKEECFVEINRGHPMDFDGLRLFPAQRPRTSDLIPGFAHPQRFRVEVAEMGETGRFRTVFDQTASDAANPGQNPLTIRFPSVRASRVRVLATRLWKISPDYPAFFGLSEVQILNGETILSDGAAVVTSERGEVIPAHADLFWSAAALTDGYGPTGRLIPQREWLEKLALRHDLELRKHELSVVMEQISSRSRAFVLSTTTVLALLGIAAMIYLPLRYRQRSQQVRKRISMDLHDEVGSSLGSIQIYAGLAERKPHPVEELATIQRIAGETVSAVRDIVWLLRRNSSARISTTDHLKESTAIMLEPMAWTFDADPPSRTKHLPDDLNRNLFLFHREALHNILRHSKAQNVEIQIQHPARQLVIKISDDGCGITPEQLSKPATLRALRLRADAMRGDLEISSKPGAGTSIQLTVPI